MNRITLTLSTELMETVDEIAAILGATRVEVISFYLEGSTNLRKIRLPKAKKFCARGSTNPRK